MDKNKLMNEIVSLCNSRGFIFSGSEIYGGLANSWDYGPLGVELKRNIKNQWWKSFVSSNIYNVGLDSAILMNPKVWKASGHLDGFNDPLIDCRDCKSRHRADKIIESYIEKKGLKLNPEALSNAEMSDFIKNKNISCNNCGSKNFTEVRSFNLMFKTQAGVTKDNLSDIYLRPETAQGIFVNFKNVLRSSRKKLPFGIAQIGKSFRNEITPGNFIFRTKEFEQMELEFFCKPSESSKWFEYWLEFSQNWLLRMGINKDSINLREHDKDELSHYSSRTVDINFKFPFGQEELWGIANRGDYDLRQHSESSGVNLEYVDQESGEKYTPYCIEPSLGLDRVMLAFLTDAYTKETDSNGKERVVLKLHPLLSPFKLAVLPLIKKRHSEKAREVYEKLNLNFVSDFDDSGSIGKRYRRHDEIGTPFCITIDDEAVKNNEVTVRFRDSMRQESVKIDNLLGYITSKINN